MQPTPRNQPIESPDFGHRLSCLLDGEADAQGAEEASLAWRERPECRAQWHRWHLIGDVMRSGELASNPAHDAAFLAGMRARLAQEPPLLAPAPLVARRPRHVWVVPAAVAAGFVAVAGVVVAVRVQDGGATPAMLASSSARPGVVAVGTAAPPVGGAPAADATMLRDAEIDRYFLAHRKAMSPVTPGGAPRNVDVMMQR